MVIIVGFGGGVCFCEVVVVGNVFCVLFIDFVCVWVVVNKSLLLDFFDYEFVLLDLVFL